MSHPEAPTVTRHCDVAIVGGSAAGLAAALQLGRQRRSVIVIDSGSPRNAPAPRLHGFLSQDGTPPAELLAAGRREVRSYGGEILADRVVRVTPMEGRFVVALEQGHTVVARRVLAATGVVDELPEVDGLTDHWGDTVIHCPFCHGYEVRDQRLVQLVTHPAGLHTAPLFRQLTARLTVVIHPEVETPRRELDALRSAGVDVRTGTARRVTVGADGRLAGIELDDGSTIDADAVAVGPRFRTVAEPFVGLGLRPEPHPSGLGDVIAVDATGATTVEGVYAAGTMTDPGQQLVQAAAHGSKVGAMVAFSLADEDLHNADRPSSSAADWDHRYSGERIWSGNPNGSLVAEAAHLSAGRALDVGAGEGGDAIWLAQQGWTVTASDISGHVLVGVQAEAARRGLPVTCLTGDANAREPFPHSGFDLVTASYASIPRTPDLRGVKNVVDAVAPGGTLLVVSHDLAAMQDARHQHRPFDPDAYLHIDDFVEELRESGDWTIEVNDRRPRPPGSATAAHHVDDLVLRARRAG